MSGTAQDEARRRLIAALTEEMPTQTSVQPTATVSAHEAVSGELDETVETVSSPAEAVPVAAPAPAPAPAPVQPVESTSPPAPEAAPAPAPTPIPLPSPIAHPQQPPAKSARQEERERQRKEKQKEKEYKAQVLARIRSDQEERRRRSQSGYQRTQTQTSPSPSSPVTAVTASSRPHEKPPSQIRLQVRLLNGTPIRNTFTPTQTISSAVRPWIEAQYPDAANTPYNLKLILTPLPSRQLSVSEEEKALGEVDLGGSSASLVMTPVRTYSESYAQSGAESWTALPVKGLYAGIGLLSSAVGGVASGVGRFLGIGRDPDAPGVIGGRQGGASEQEEEKEEEEDETVQRQRQQQQRESRIRTLDRKDENQFYNGNSLDFEYRDDHDKK